MTANQNSRSLGLEPTPNKNLSASDVSVPSHISSDRPVIQRRALAPDRFFHRSPSSHHSRAVLSPLIPRREQFCGIGHFGTPWSFGPWTLVISRPASPNFLEFTLHNPLI